MSKNKYRFDNSEAQIEEKETGYTAECQCGWKSELKGTREEAIISFENHMRSNPRHVVEDEGRRINYFSLVIAAIGIIYIISSFDLVPDTLVLVGWIEDILIGVICLIFIKEGLNNKSPTEILSESFS